MVNFTPGRRTGIHLTGGWLDPREFLDVFGEEEISRRCRNSNAGPSKQQ